MAEVTGAAMLDFRASTSLQAVSAALPSAVPCYGTAEPSTHTFLDAIEIRPFRGPPVRVPSTHTLLGNTACAAWARRNGLPRESECERFWLGLIEPSRCVGRCDVDVTEARHSTVAISKAAEF